MFKLLNGPNKFEFAQMTKEFNCPTPTDVILDTNLL